MANQENKQWKVVRTVELNSSAENVWATVGGFYTVHLWHPDINKTEIGKDQVTIPEIRRILTSHDQPPTTEELVHLDNQKFFYVYKEHSGAWGEEIKNYHAEIRVIEIEVGKKCLMQWTGHFLYTEDALSEFYENGFAALRKKFN